MFSHENAELTTPDAVLAAIPLSLFAVAFAGLAASLSVPMALGLGSLPATGAIGYALFWSPPEGIE